MSLFGSIQLANNALRAQQIGLQVVGQNISNANTPGYIREQVVLSPAPTQQVGSLLLGLGVQVDGVVQIIDNFLEERLRGASSERANTSAQEEAYVQLEGLIGELGDTDLSTSLTNFFNSVAEVLNQPESVAVRNLAVLRGQTLSDDV
ncbi:MAG: flagellar basal body protein, partial [Pirellulales bacterium]